MQNIDIPNIPVNWNVIGGAVMNVLANGQQLITNMTGEQNFASNAHFKPNQIHLPFDDFTNPLLINLQVIGDSYNTNILDYREIFHDSEGDYNRTIEVYLPRVVGITISKRDDFGRFIDKFSVQYAIAKSLDMARHYAFKKWRRGLISDPDEIRDLMMGDFEAELRKFGKRGMRSIQVKRGYVQGMGSKVNTRIREGF
ncbi:hypothetical protein [Hymenobacter sp. BRD67]|uniref:hypothetical protein n=1 Tax=Hymenobacter sp. BRD67 TaxID=2675877 RepID=UPI001563C614|nr:hypothetical protein [Hymenobacter sp. BRD67]QKG55127.1 hypothetical protein GKZ67_22165 [Hymenobacter sp. BRD67]